MYFDLKFLQCYCSNFFDAFSTLKEGSCKKSSLTCKTIYDNNPIGLNYFYSYRICGKRSGSTFVDVIRPQVRFSSSSPSCPTGYTFCGGENKDSWICVENQSKCPINHIYIDKLADPTVLPAGYEAQPLGNEMNVLFSSEADKSPIARLKITAGRVCSIPNEFDYPPDRKFYKLLNIDSFDRCSYQIAGLYEDPRFTKIGSINEQRLFDDNKVSPVLDNLPLYNTSEAANYDWNLYSSSFYEWNYDCDRYQDYENSISKQEVIETIDTTDSVFNMLIWLLVICGIQCVISCFIINVIIIHYSYNNTTNGKQCVEREQQPKFETVSFPIKSVLLILKAIFFYGTISIANGYFNKLNVVVNLSCLDYYSQDIFIEQGDSVASAKSWNVWGLITTIVSILFTIWIIYDVKCRNKGANQAHNEQEIIEVNQHQNLMT